MVTTGQEISHYRVEEELGGGGMGIVYRARDLRLGRAVALKFLPDGLAEDPQALERFRREAKAASSLSHPHICTIYEIDEHEGRPFLAMELMQGRTVKHLLEDGPLDPDRVVALAIQIADGLAAAHEAGIVHRDVKPANLFVTERGDAKILDFGLAKLVAPPEAETLTLEGAPPPPPTLTETGTTVGTWAYMSPEQLLARGVDARSDLFSFGAVLYEMATGRQAFGGAALGAVTDAILHRHPPSIAALRPDLPAEVGRIVSRCLEKDPELRYQGAAGLRGDLRRLRRDSPDPVRPAPPSTRRSFLRPVVVAAGLLLLALVGLGAWWWLGRTGPEDTGTPAPTRRPQSVAILPFHNLADPRWDYLRLAVPDEITTTLAHARDLAVRPFAAARRIAQGEGADPQTAGRELGTTHVVTGQLVPIGEELRLTLEAVAVDDNRLVWRQGIEVSPSDLLTFRDELSELVERGLMPALETGTAEPGTRPRSARAYELYLQSLALTWDEAPNAEALSMLERAVDLDPGYAPAWAELARRLATSWFYWGGGDEAYERSMAAAERALELDPGLVAAAVELSLRHTEGGDHEAAYRRTRKLVERRPDSGYAHFGLSYVLRYAGLLDEAIRHCKLAVALDPGNPAFRSCAIPFTFAGELDRARDFVQLDAGSTWSELVGANLALLQGREAEAANLFEATGALPLRMNAAFGVQCIEGAPTDEIARAARPLYEVHQTLGDPERKFWDAGLFSYCGLTDMAHDLLRWSLEGEYCPYPAMLDIPLLANLRAEPSFAELRRLGVACRRRALRLIRDNPLPEVPGPG